MAYDLPILKEISDLEQEMLKNDKSSEIYKNLYEQRESKISELMVLHRKKLVKQEEYMKNTSIIDKTVLDYSVAGNSYSNKKDILDRTEFYLLLKHFDQIPPLEEDIYLYRGLSQPNIESANHELFVSVSVSLKEASYYTSYYLSCCLYRIFIPKGSKILPMYAIPESRFIEVMELYLPVGTTYLNLEKLQFPLYLSRLEESFRPTILLPFNIQNMKIIPSTFSKDFTHLSQNFKDITETKINSYGLALIIYEKSSLKDSEIFDITSFVEAYLKCISEDYNVDYDFLLNKYSEIRNGIRYFNFKDIWNGDIKKLLEKTIVYVLSTKKEKSIKYFINPKILNLVEKVIKFKKFINRENLISLIKEQAIALQVETLDTSYIISLCFRFSLLQLLIQEYKNIL